MGDRVDIGPHILLTEYRNMLDFLERLGTREQTVWQQSQKFITLVDAPRPVEIRMRALPPPLHFLPSMVGAPQVSLADMASNARLFWRVARLGEAEVVRLDDIDAETYLRRQGVSERFIDWFWRSACMAIMNVPLERCSTGALLSFFRQMIGRSGYKVGFAGVGLGDLFVPAATRVIEAAGGQVLTGAEAVQLDVADGSVHGLRLADGERIHADQCVAALPPQCLRSLLPDGLARQHSIFRDLTRFAPSPYISCYLWFDRKLTEDRFWTRVWSPSNLSYDTYDLSNIRPDWSDRPSVIASNIIYSQRAAGLSDDEIVSATRRELAEFLPKAATAELRHAAVHHIPMAIPAPYPGSESLRPDTRAPVEGLYLAGDWIRTGLPSSMEGAVRGGRMAAEAVLAARGRPATLTAPLPRAQGVIGLLGSA